MALTVDELRKLILYEHETGTLYRKSRRGNKEVASFFNLKRPHITINGERLNVRSIIYALYTGYWPSKPVKASAVEAINRGFATRYNTSKASRQIKTKIGMCGYRGVLYRPNCVFPYEAKTKLNGKIHSLGRFRTAREAALKYDEVVLELFGPDALTNASLGLLDDVSIET
jgi:hypothetical protein